MNLKTSVRKAAVDNDIGGVMALSKHCDLSYERTVRVWNGSKTAKFEDVEKIFKSLGFNLDYYKIQVLPCITTKEIQAITTKKLDD